MKAQGNELCNTHYVSVATLFICDTLTLTPNNCTKFQMMQVLLTCVHTVDIASNF